MKDSEALISARQLIDTPEKWVKGQWHCLPGQYARGDDLSEIGRSEIDRYCVEGALDVANHSTRRGEWRGEMSDLLCEIATEMVSFPCSPMSLNDAYDTTHDDMMNLLDKGIAKLQEEGR